MSSIRADFSVQQGRLAGLATFLATASGLSLFGIAAAFWGLVLGLLVHQIYRARQRSDVK